MIVWYSTSSSSNNLEKKNTKRTSSYGVFFREKDQVQKILPGSASLGSHSICISKNVPDSEKMV